MKRKWLVYLKVLFKIERRVSLYSGMFFSFQPESFAKNYISMSCIQKYQSSVVVVTQFPRWRKGGVMSPNLTSIKEIKWRISFQINEWTKKLTPTSAVVPEYRSKQKLGQWGENSFKEFFVSMKDKNRKLSEISGRYLKPIENGLTKRLSLSVRLHIPVSSISATSLCPVICIHTMSRS